MTERPVELLHAIAGPDAAFRPGQLGLSGSGVVYVLTIADTTRVASFLRTQGIDAHAHSGETESERRPGRPASSPATRTGPNSALQRVVGDRWFIR